MWINGASLVRVFFCSKQEDGREAMEIEEGKRRKNHSLVCMNSVTHPKTSTIHAGHLIESHVGYRYK